MQQPNQLRQELIDAGALRPRDPAGLSRFVIPDGAAVLPLDGRAKAVAARLMRKSPQHEDVHRANEWVGELFSIIDRGRVQSRNLIVDRTGGRRL